MVAPEASIPMRAGTGEQGVFEHVDSRAELLPEGGSPQGIHFHQSCICAHTSGSPFRISNIRSSVLSIPEKAVKMRPHLSEFGWKSNAHGRRENFYRADLVNVFI